MSALENFDEGVAEVRLLLQLRESDPSEGVDRLDRDNAVNRASVVLLVSHFESYLKTLAEKVFALIPLQMNSDNFLKKIF